MGSAMNHHQAIVIFTDKINGRSKLEEQIYQYWRNKGGEINFWDEDDADEYPLIAQYIESKMFEDDILITYYG